MSFKALLVCAAALLMQSISGQRCGCYGGYRYGAFGNAGRIGSYRAAIGPCAVTSGGEMLVTSVCPISPCGLAVESQVDLLGNVEILGEMPFLSAVELQGVYDTAGAAIVDYSCGSCGNVGIGNVFGGCGCGCI